MNKCNSNLDYLLAPKTIAIVGASTKPNSYGLALLEMLTKGNFNGTISVSYTHLTLPTKA